MIPNKNESTTIQSTMTGNRGKFSVHEHAHEKIMGVLTNLYEDPENAVVREYLTNALDAQRERQTAQPGWQWRPIEVTTPSHFNKTYVIRDFGVGMSVGDIENVYSQYGYSTKEHTNDQTGMLGLGSKCALTYTGQFTVTGYKNGLRTRALITLNEDEVPEYIILDTSATTEPDGVEISIPVKHNSSFKEKTARFLRWWDAGLVLLDGQEPARHGYTEVKPGVFLIEHNGYAWESPQSYVIMGGVPYEVDSEYVDASLRNAKLGFAAYVPMGAVDFPPSRERLRYNSRTKAEVARISEGLFDAVLTTKLDEITNASNHREAWNKWSSLPGHFASAPKAITLSYKGDAFIKSIDHPITTLDWDYKGHGQLSERRSMHLNAIMNHGTLVVTGVASGSKPTAYFKKKVKFYLESNAIPYHTALLVENDIDSPWLSWAPRVTADDIKEIKLPKDTTGAPAVKREATYEYYTLDSSGNPTSDSGAVVPANGRTIVYISPADMRETYRKNGTDAKAVISALGENYVLVVLATNRFEKFLRTHSGAIRAEEAFKKRMKEHIDAATDAEYIVGNLGWGEKHFIKVANPAQILDKDLVDLINTFSQGVNTGNLAKANQLQNVARRAGVWVDIEERNSITNPCDRYPLISVAGNNHIDDTILYINAVWEKRYKQ